MNRPETGPFQTSLDLGSEADSIGFMIRLVQLELFGLFHRQMAETGITPGEYTLLALLARNPSAKQKQLADFLKIKPPHMTKLVQRLVNQGYIDRVIPDVDRRSVLLSLTRAGRRFVTSHEAGIARLHQLEAAGLTELERAELLRLLRRLLDGKDQV